MRKTFSRSIKSSIIHGFRIDIVNDEPVTKKLEPVTVVGAVKSKDAFKILKESAEGAELVTVTKIETREDVYKISLDDFMKYGEKVDSKSTENEEKPKTNN